jgi:hypothetical protein
MSLRDQRCDTGGGLGFMATGYFSAPAWNKKYHKRAF